MRIAAPKHFSRQEIVTSYAGNVAQAIAQHAVTAGHQVMLSNSRGPASLAELVGRLGANASAGTISEAAQAGLVILAVGWDDVPEAVQDIPDWDGRVVIDTTNQWHNGPGTEVDLGDQAGSERNAALMPGARVVKAFNTLSLASPSRIPNTSTVASSSFWLATMPTPRPSCQRSSDHSGSRP